MEGVDVIEGGFDDGERGAPDGGVGKEGEVGEVTAVFEGKHALKYKVSSMKY